MSGPAERDDLSGHRMLNIEPGRSGEAGDGADGLPGGGVAGGVPDGDDEPALRRLLQGAVAGLEPSSGALEHLRRAVPARRARKRQAVVGAAAAAVLIGTAVPAFVHVASSEGVTAANPVNAGHGEQAQGGTGTETGVEGGGRTSETPASSASPSQGVSAGATGPRQPTFAGGTTVSAGASLPPGSAPRCAAGQLGVGAAEAGAPGADGAVYGTFRIANVSARACVVDGGGGIGFEARGAADPARISVVRHTAGDPAGGLPDPAREVTSLLLEPNGSYEVRFAWIPSDTCPTTGPTEPPTSPPTEPPTTPPPTATPSTGTGGTEPTSGTGDGGTGDTGTGSGGTGSGASGDTGTGTDAEGTSPQLLRADTPAEGSVALTHTPAPAAPPATVTVPHACAGTVYRTGLLPSA